MRIPQVLRKTRIAGHEVSSVFVPVGGEGGYFETMLFLDHEVNGLENFETYSLFDSWEQNHDQLCSKVRSVLAYGPVYRKFN